MYGVSWKAQGCPSARSLDHAVSIAAVAIRTPGQEKGRWRGAERRHRGDSGQFPNRLAMPSRTAVARTSTTQQSWTRQNFRQWPRHDFSETAASHHQSHRRAGCGNGVSRRRLELFCGRADGGIPRGIPEVENTTRRRSGRLGPPRCGAAVLPAPRPGLPRRWPRAPRRAAPLRSGATPVRDRDRRGQAGGAWKHDPGPPAVPPGISGRSGMLWPPNCWLQECKLRRGNQDPWHGPRLRLLRRPLTSTCMRRLRSQVLTQRARIFPTRAKHTHMRRQTATVMDRRQSRAA